MPTHLSHFTGIDPRNGDPRTSPSQVIFTTIDYSGRSFVPRERLLTGRPFDHAPQAQLLGDRL
jgi:hypothetical protein